MDALAQRLETVRANIARAAQSCGRAPEEITLVAATKTQTDETIRRAIAAGITVCGENRVQEFTAHLAAGAYEGARVHFIGHLQTNKVKYIVGKVDLIHSVSSDKLLLAIQRQAEKLDLVQDVLLEVNLAGEESKFGLTPEQVLPAAELAAGLANVRLRGLMCIPPPSTGPGKNLPYFANLTQLAVDIRQKIGDNRADVVYLSMGMSDDYQDAVCAGATHVRLGTALFGPRPPVLTNLGRES
ncbi:MAG TPA: YggS family pyridoxal phosphate-dependent enzyme [Candidatus Enterenecus stercoripullorum]|nr:YggS family pyridoxal phosphate-dependent enzyme [Candidatus Enterenecus stercoripullorum]